MNYFKKSPYVEKLGNFNFHVYEPFVLMAFLTTVVSVRLSCEGTIACITIKFPGYFVLCILLNKLLLKYVIHLTFFY